MSAPPANVPPSGRLLLEAGKTIARKYVLTRPAGFGGMAELWVATNTATDAEVCVKVYVREPGRGEDPNQQVHEAEAIERFRREAYAAARLSHRAIVRVFDLLELDVEGEVNTDGSPHAYAMVMELLRGETLGDLLAKRGKLPLEEALDLFLPVVSALGHAHRASVIHRDLKPDNIFLAVDPDGHVSPKVLDFGVSKLSNADAITNDGVIVGTPSFMSPEQAKGARQVDARSDVFSAGILFYMMLDGANPFDDGNFASVIDAVLRRDVPPLADLPPPIWAVLHQALEKEPNARWGDATEMGIALRKAAGRKSTTGSIPMLPLPPPSSGRVPRTSGVPRDSVSVPPAGPDSIPATGIGQTLRHRRRAIIASGLGGATLILLAVLVIPWSRGGQPSARSAAVGEAPPPAATPLPAVADPRVEAAPTTSSATSAPGSARSAPTVKRPPAPSRRPGEEPNQARDPGF